MASITERGNSFRITVSAGRDRNGKQILKYLTYTPKETTPAAIRKEVEKAALDFETKVKSGKYFDGDQMTFSELVQHWKTTYAVKNLAVHTVESYEDILNRHFLQPLGNMKVSKIKAVNIQIIIDNMSESGLAPATVRRSYNVIRGILHKAYKWGIVSENVADRCELPKIKRPNMRYWTPEEAQTFLKALTLTYHYKCTGTDRVISSTGKTFQVVDYTREYTISRVWKEFFSLELHTGMRRGELCGLRWCDIDLKNKTVSVNQVLSKVNAGYIVKAPKTESSKRTIAVSQAVIDSLKGWKKLQKEECLRMGEIWQGERGDNYDQNYVFTRTDGSGKPIYPDSVGEKFHKIIRAYNGEYGGKLPDINFHGTRHTSATLLIAEGVDVVEVSHRLGHSKTSTTEDIYAHQLKEVDEHAANVLDNVLGTKVL